MHIKQHLDSDKKHLAGVQVEIVRLVLEAEPEFDSEVLPMAYVRRLDNGEQLLCFPEELSEPLALPAGYVPPAQRDLHAARERVVSALVADQVSAYAGDSDCFKTNGSLSAVFRNGHRGFGTMTATELLDLTQGQMLEGEDAQAAALLQAHVRNTPAPSLKNWSSRPICCPHCGGRNILDIEVNWKATSLNDCDSENICEVAEYQCQGACEGRSFFA